MKVEIRIKALISSILRCTTAAGQYYTTSVSVN